MNDNPTIFDAEMVGELVGIKGRQVRNLVNDHGLPHTRGGRGPFAPYLFTPEQADKFVEFYRGFKGEESADEGNGANKNSAPAPTALIAA